jgi:hypothetical protein
LNLYRHENLKTWVVSVDVVAAAAADDEYWFPYFDARTDRQTHAVY